MVCLGAAIACPPSGAVTLVHNGPLAPFATIEQPTTGFRPQSAPLFEKERNLRGLALIAHFARPFSHVWPRTRPALTADNHPMNTFEIDLPYRPEQRLDRKEAYGRLRLPDMPGA
jgi:hypothetical protein